MQQGTASRVFGLDVLRALAIALVVASHAELLLGPASERSPYFHYAGFQGVELFFTLSGFLIGSILLKAPLTGPRDIARFWARRWMRTLPAFVMALVVLSLLYQPPREALLRAGLFLGTLTPAMAEQPLTFFPVSWSLGIEEWFYLVLGLSVLVLGRRRRVLFALYVVAVGARLWWLLRAHEAPYDVAHTSVPLRMDALLVGVIAASLRPLRARLSPWPMLTLRLLYGAGLAWGLHAWVSQPGLQYESRLFAALFPPFNSLMAALLVFDLSVTPRWLAWLSERLWAAPRRAVSFVAAISYSLYLYHLELILLARDTGRLGWPGVALVVIAGSAVAFASYELVELPFLRLRDRWVPDVRAQRS